MKYKERIKTLKGKMILVPATFALAAGLALTGCGDADALESNTETSEIVSEIVSEEPTEEVSEITSEIVQEEAPEIVNTMLTFEEAQAYIEDLKTKYPDMTEEQIVTLFVNFNLHSLDADTIDYYSSNYHCNFIHNIVGSKISSVGGTYYILKGEEDGIEYKDTWCLTDFVTNEQLKPMAEQIEEYLNKMAYTPDNNEYGTLKDNLYNYQIGKKSLFMYQYDDPQKETTDLDGICYFVARYNDICNSQTLGFNEEADISPLQRYQNVYNLSK